MPDDKTIEFVIIFVTISLLCLGLGSWLIGKVLAIWDRVVNHSQENDADVMSRAEGTRPSVAPSSLQTDSRQTADRPAPPAPSRDVMLNTYKILRKYGMPREESRTMLKALNLPLDNNLWTEAAPPPDPYVTPIAGRPTSAQFQDDELAYEAPPRS